MYVAKKVFIPMNLLIKMKFSLPWIVSTKGMVISLQLQKQDNNTHFVYGEEEGDRTQYRNNDG